MEIREEVEDVLELVEDSVVHGQLSGHHLLEVVSDVLEVFEETLEGVKLAADSLAQRPHRLVLDVPAHHTYIHGGGEFAVHLKYTQKDTVSWCKRQWRLCVNFTFATLSKLKARQY